MAKFALIGPSYTSQSVNADCQSTINLYPEVIESGAGNSQIVLYPSPGLKSFVDLTPIVPPPPVAPRFYQTETIFQNTGSNVGNNHISSFVPGLGTGGETIEVGDTVILAFYCFLNNGATPNYPTAVAFSKTAVNFATFTQIGTIVPFGVAASRGILAVFTGKALIPVSGTDSLDFTYTFNANANNTDWQSNWSCFKHVGLIDQHSSQAFLGATSFAAPALPLTQTSFVLSYIYPQLNAASVTTASPYFKFTNNVVGCGLFYQHPPSNDLIAAPGVYSPTWTSVSGAQDAGVLNFNFKLP